MKPVFRRLIETVESREADRVGPQKQPASVARIQAQTKHAMLSLFDNTIGSCVKQDKPTFTTTATWGGDAMKDCERIRVHQTKEPTHEIRFTRNGRKYRCTCYGRGNVVEMLQKLPHMGRLEDSTEFEGVYEIESRKFLPVEHFTNAEVSAVVAHHSDDIKLTDWFSFLDSSGNPIPELHQIDLIDILREYASSRGYSLAEDVTLR